MVAGWVREDTGTVEHAAAFGVGGSPIEPPDSGEGYGGRAHRAGL